MIWFFTPYAFNKKLFEAFDAYMNLITDNNDWVCTLDGDTAFLCSDFGHHMQEYVNKYPDTGIFTSYVSRSRTPWMMPPNHIFNNTNIIDHKQKAEWHFKNQHLDVSEINTRVIGCLMLMKKSTWLLIRDEVAEKCIDKEILSVDTIISKTVIEKGLKLRLMKGIYIFHYYRHLEGANSKKHLQ
jgi:hypothetical protein